MTPRLINADYPCRVAVLRDCVLADVHVETPDGTIDEAQPMRDAAEQVITARGNAKVLVVIRQGCAPPPAAVRDAQKAWLTAHGDNVEGFFVLEGQGFWAAAFRSLVTLLASAARIRNVRILGSLGDALPHLELTAVEAQHAALFFAERPSLVGAP